MNIHNPYQIDINVDGFVTHLRDPENIEAWETLLNYVRAQVAYEIQSQSIEQGRATAIEEYTSEVIYNIQSALDQFEQRNPFSAWVDALLRHSLADTNLKQTLQALTRFLVASHQLSTVDKAALEARIQRLDNPEHDILQAAMHGQLFLTARQHYLWYHARRQLLDDPQFQQLLDAMVYTGIRQASTLLHWYTSWKGQTNVSGRSMRDRKGKTYQIENFSTAESLAADLAGGRVDPNEAQKALAYLRGVRDAKKYFEYLRAIVQDGRAVIRSAQTLGYYRELLTASERHLRGMEAKDMALALGWAIRLLRYYRAVPEAAEEIAAQRRQAQEPPPREPPPAAPARPAPAIPAVGDVFVGEVIAVDETAVLVAVPGFSEEQAAGVIAAEALGGKQFQVGGKARVEVIDSRTRKSGRVVLGLRPAVKPPKDGKKDGK